MSIRYSCIDILSRAPSPSVGLWMGTFVIVLHIDIFGAYTGLKRGLERGGACPMAGLDNTVSRDKTFKLSHLFGVRDHLADGEICNFSGELDNSLEMKLNCQNKCIHEERKMKDC